MKKLMMLIMFILSVSFVNAGVLYNLSNTDIGNWINVSNFVAESISSDTYNNKIYLAISDGKFGVYNISDNQLYDLSSTDTGNWIGTTTLRSTLVYSNEIVYIGGSSGIFGEYNSTSNILSDLRNSDTGNWIGTQSIQSMCVDNNNNEMIYILGTTGIFGVYNRTSNITSDLRGVDQLNWVGTTTLYDCIQIEDKLYISGTSGKFGVYNISDNISYNLSGVDYNNFFGTAILQAMSKNEQNDTIYIGSTSMTNFFSSYNVTNMTASNLSGVDENDFFNGTAFSTIYNDGLVYLAGTTNGKFGVYNSTDNIAYDLTNTSVNNWNNNTVFTTITTINDLVFIGGFTGVFAMYNISASPCIEDWIMNNTECNGYNYTIEFYDNNMCGTYNDLPVSNGTIMNCEDNEITGNVLNDVDTQPIIMFFVALIVIALSIGLAFTFFDEKIEHEYGRYMIMVIIIGVIIVLLAYLFGIIM